MSQQLTDLPPQLLDVGDEERPRSLLDLLDLAVLDLDLAAWLVGHVSAGTSLIVGSGPGGVGKTTTMRALLAFGPGRLRYTIALPGQVSQIGSQPSCAISNELSDHPPPTYLWGDDLRHFFALSAQGHMLVGNMHVDDVESARGEIVGDNQVPEAQFRSVGLFVFVKVEGADPTARRIRDTSLQRYVNQVSYTDGSGPHQSVYTREGGLEAGAPRDQGRQERCRAFLAAALAGPERRLEVVRQQFLAAGLA